MRKLLLGLGLVLMSFSVAHGAAPADFRDLVKAVGPAVVNINTERTVTAQSSPFPFSSPFDELFRNSPHGDFFERFYGNRGGNNNRQAPRSKQRSLGSGFIISADGYIVTNHHVVSGADAVNVTMEVGKDQEKTYKAEIVGTDQDTDLALLKIDAKNLPYLKFGDSESIEVGEWVLAIGNPFGLDHTVTAGILSAKGRNIRSGPYDSFLQTDASINPGNSGGPLLNMAGEVIGINAAIIANGQGIGFAIPSNMAGKIIDDLKNDRKVTRGWIGVTIQSLGEKDAKALGLKEKGGALVGDVVPDNPAAKAGVLPGDVIIAVNGKKVNDSDGLLRTIASLKPGEKAVLTVWRNNGTKDLSITLGERANGGSETKSAEKESAVSSLGLEVRALTQEEASRLNLEKGTGLVILQVREDSVAEEAGIRRGDVILAVSGAKVDSVKQFTDIVENQGKKRGAVMLHLSRQGQKFFRTLEVTAK